MKNKLKKIAAIILTLLMVISMSPGQTLAHGGDWDLKEGTEFRVKNSNGPGEKGNGLGGDHGYIKVTYDGITVNLEAGEEHTFVYHLFAGLVKVDFVPDTNWSFKYYVIDNPSEHNNNDPDYINPWSYAGESGANNLIKLNPKWDTNVTYTVTWMNGATQLERDTNVAYYTQPDYNGATPTKAADAQYTYTFAGWSTNPNAMSGLADTQLPNVTESVTYYAIFSTTTNAYTVTWMNGTTQLERDTNVAYGTQPDYNGATPTKAATAQYTYTFAGWNIDKNAATGSADTALPTVTGSVTYYAIFTATTNAYTVTWMNDTTQLEQDTNVVSGTQPDYNGVTPTKAATAQYTYTFIGWNTDKDATTALADTALPTVSDNVTYYAIYSKTVNNYTVTWKNFDEAQLEQDTNVPYGTQPDYNQATDPARAADAQYTYTFIGWNTDKTATTGLADTALPTVSGNVTYYAIYSKTVNNYTVTWKNYDEAQLEQDTNVPYGTQPDYNQATDPAKAADAQYTYTFIGWNTDKTATTALADTALPTVSGNVTYYAIYSKTVNNYTVTWKNYDETQLEQDTNVPYGTQPDYNQATDPARAADAQYTYTFIGWNTDKTATTALADTALPTVSGNVTYYAIYSTTVNKYTVTWKNYDETQLEQDTNVPYGTQPDYNQATDPARAADAQYTYTFIGWNTDKTATTALADTALPTVSGNVTYYAIYSKTVNKYTVTWKNYDETQLEQDTNVPYGTQPDYNQATDPAKAADAQYTYTFIGWNTDKNATTALADTALPTVSGNVTYYAIYSKTVNNYTVTWKNFDEAQLEQDTNVPFGTQPDYNQATDPAKAADAQYTYTFIGWNTDKNATTALADTALPTVSGNVTYYAIYSKTVNNYTVTWKNFDEAQLEQDTNVPFGTQPDYNQATDPAKAADAQYTYTFIGWNTDKNATTALADTALPTVSGNVTYYAIYSKTVNNYTVTWKNFDEAQLEQDTNVPFGTQPDYNQATDPAKAADAQYTYTFIGWNTDKNATTALADTALPTVSGNVTYYAIYSKTVNNYTVTWKNFDEAQLEQDTNVPFGTQPDYNQATDPAKAADAQYTYTFIGWNTDKNATTALADTALPTVSGNVTYYAIYSKTVNNYTVTWNNYDNSLIEQDAEVAFGTTPSFDSATPTKPSTAQFSYTFTGWSPQISEVTGDITYTAQFSETLRSYPVTFVNFDATTLKIESVLYGNGATAPTVPGRTGFTFTGWDKAFNNITGPLTVYAQFSINAYPYTVNYVNASGAAIATAKTGSANYSTSVTESAIAITGYTARTASQTITISTTGNVITFVYDAVIVTPPTEEIVDTPTPLAGPSWALLNLIMMIAAFIFAASLMITYFQKKKEEKNEDTKRKLGWIIACVLIAIASIITFILTEDMTAPMVITDNWTILMIIYAALGIGTMILARKKKEEVQQA